MRRGIASSRGLAVIGLSVMALCLALVVAVPAGAAVGGVLRVLHPSPGGNGRAIAVDPRTGRLFYTNFGDPHIYVIRSDGSWVATLTPIGPDGPVVYGALSWQPTSAGGVLWGGRFDGSGAVDRIDPATGLVTPAFEFPFPGGETCYPQPPGYIDGLAYDGTDGSLWLGDDNATAFYRVTTNGAVLGRYGVPAGRCRTGIAVDGPFLWLGLQSGPDTAPYDLARVAKTDTTVPLQGFAFGSAEGPEGLAIQNSAIRGLCVLWSNQFGDTTTLRAWQLPPGLCGFLPQPTPLPTPGRRSVGLLTFQLQQPDGQLVQEFGQPEVRGCVATVVDSENLSTIVTAGHCLANTGSFTGEHVNLQFAPGHTGPCWDNPTHPAGSHQLEVSRCGVNPYGVWIAGPADVHLSPLYNPDTATDQDYAFITVHAAPGRAPVQSVVGGFRLIWDTTTRVTDDPLQSQPWETVSYASDDPFFTPAYTFGPFQCTWSGDPANPFLGASATRIGVGLVNGGNCDSFGPPLLGPFTLPSTGLPFGSSGSPFINASNTPDGSLAIGAILSTGAQYSVNGVTVPKLEGTKFGDDAQPVLNLAQTAEP